MNMNMYNNRNYRKSNKLVPIALMVIWGAALLYAIWSAIFGYKSFFFYDAPRSYGLSAFVIAFMFASIFAVGASMLFAGLCLVAKLVKNVFGKDNSIPNNGYYNGYNMNNGYNGNNRYNSNSGYNGYNVYNTNNGNNIRRW